MTRTVATERTAESDAFLDLFMPGGSPAIANARRTILKLNSPINGRTIQTILVTGETGSGKNHFSRVLSGHKEWLAIRNSDSHLGLPAGLKHYTTGLRELNVPAFSRSVVESELFGHVKGAFTGALDRDGLLGVHDKDILLDEIGDISLQLQAKLLTVLETGRFRPVGGNDENKCSARLILATNRNLEQMVRRGRFREDLFWRINMFVIHVPPLREQQDNIPTIIENIEKQLDDELNTAPGERFKLPRLPEAAKRWAQAQPWPGNIRQLKHAIRRWRFELGLLRFEDLAGPSDPLSSSSRDDPSGLSQTVVSRLNAAIANPSKAFGDLDSLLRGFGNEIRVSIADWYISRKPSTKELLALFPDCQPRSVRNKIAKWRHK